MKPKKLKKLPKFNSENEEAEFWDTHSPLDYYDWSNARHVTFPNLKPSTKTISLRLPEYLLNNIKAVANKRDVPYQSLIKLMLARAVENPKDW